MLATQKGRSKPVRISSSHWLKLISPPGMRGGMIAELEGGTPPTNLYEYQNKGVRKFAIHKCMKRKNEDDGCDLGDESRNGSCWCTPGSFRKNGKHRTYGIRNLEECVSS